MKKHLLLIILLIIINITNVSASEEIIPIRKNNNILGVNSIIRIDDDLEKVKVESIAVKGLNFYTSLKKNNKYKIKYIIDGNYKYEKKSIKIKKYAFDNKYAIYRTINTPLKKLYKCKNIDLRDEVLDKKLKEKGYTGIEELHEYYKDYYKVNKLTFSEIKKITKGKLTYIKESNYEVNKIAYNYYYEKILIIENKNLNIELYLNNKKLTNAYEDYNYDLDILFILVR